MLLIVIFILIVVYILSVIGMWKVFRKAGCMGWLSIIPIANAFVLCKIAWGRYAWAWLWIIPFVNIVIMILTYYKLAKAFGHGAGYTVGLILLPLIFFILLGFGSDQYLGPDNGNTNRSFGSSNGTSNNDNGYDDDLSGGYYEETQQTSGAVMFCPYCGKEIPAGGQFCRYCGSKL